MCNLKLQRQLTTCVKVVYYYVKENKGVQLQMTGCCLILKCAPFICEIGVCVWFFVFFCVCVSFFKGGGGCAEGHDTYCMVTRAGHVHCRQYNRDDHDTFLVCYLLFYLGLRPLYRCCVVDFFRSEMHKITRVLHI